MKKRIGSLTKLIGGAEDVGGKAGPELKVSFHLCASVSPCESLSD